MVKVLLFSILLFSMSSCHKFCKPHKFTFKGGIANVYPRNDSIPIGDTLWVKCLIPANLKHPINNSSDSENYNITGSTNLITDIHLTTPTGINMQIGAVDSFIFVDARGSLKPNPLALNGSKTISFEPGSTYFISEFGIVAKKKGIYFLAVIDIYQATKNCDKFSVSILMDNEDNHLHYMRDTYYGGYPINLIDSTHSYCFKVY